MIIKTFFSLILLLSPFSKIFADCTTYSKFGILTLKGYGSTSCHSRMGFPAGTFRHKGEDSKISYEMSAEHKTNILTYIKFLEDLNESSATSVLKDVKKIISILDKKKFSFKKCFLVVNENYALLETLPKELHKTISDHLN